MTGERTILRGTTVVDVRDGSLRRAVDITVEGGQIAAITPTSDGHPGRVAVVDARGTFAVPGFCDMHAHPLSDRRDAESALRLMLACGVTGFRQMGGSRTLLNDRSAGKLGLPIDGPAVLSTPGEVLLPFNAGTESVALQSVRQQADAGADFIKVAMVAPRVFFTAQAEAARLGLTTVGHLPVGIDVRAASDGRMRSIEHLGPGIGIVAACCDHQGAIEQAVADRPAPKFPSVPRLPFAERLMEILMARVMAKTVINPLLLAKPADADLIADAGRSFNDDKARALARVFVTDQTWQCPTLIRLRTQQFCDDPVYRDNPNNRFASKRTLKDWRKATEKYASRPETMRSAYRNHYARQLEMVRIFDQEGVKMMAGSDVSGSGWEIPGFALHDEFDQLAAAGLTPLRILQMTTINAAEFLGKTATLGTVEPGKDADIVLLSANPVENVAHLHDIAGVVRAGRYYPPETLTATIKTIAETRSAV
ncbi:amidohydrolase family protein [Mycobacterium sp.]|uniref:amidohydrolase family protein n=1 Tax=Mycobacterium sp. TaxID=1785 RepID=UPI003F98C461